MKTIAQIRQMYSATSESEWRQANGAWIHTDAYVSEEVVFPECSSAILRRGTFNGGNFNA